eukprot:854169-Rhodomonas_salina.1
MAIVAWAALALVLSRWCIQHRCSCVHADRKDGSAVGFGGHPDKGVTYHQSLRALNPRAPPWDIPAHMRDAYTMDGAIEVSDECMNVFRNCARVSCVIASKVVLHSAQDIQTRMRIVVFQSAASR